MHSARILAPLHCDPFGSALSLVSLMVICRQSAAEAMVYLACAIRRGEGRREREKQ